MSHTSSRALLALLFTAPVLSAQDPDTPIASEEIAIADPVTDHHRALARQVGTWRTAYRQEAVPGVPGMEKASESEGVETIDLLGGGLWLRSVTRSQYDGQAFEGYWVVGYDPQSKTYFGVWVSSMEEPPMMMRGTFDDERIAWTFEGDTSHGRMRSELVMSSEKESLETCWLVGEDGTQTQCMSIRRTRVTDVPVPKARESAAANDKVRPLGLGVGDWTATARYQMMPGMPAQESKCEETVRWVCGGHWTWSDYSGEMMGMPFTGHALSGFDAKSGKLVSYWMDCWTPTFMVTSGEFDAKTKTIHLTGSSRGPEGEDVPVQQTLLHSAADQRRMTLRFGVGDVATTMTIDYSRRPVQGEQREPGKAVEKAGAPKRN